MNSWKKRKQLEKEGYYKWRGNSAWNKFFYSLCYILSIQTPFSFLFLLFGGKDGFNVLSYVLLTLVIVGFSHSNTFCVLMIFQGGLLSKKKN